MRLKLSLFFTLLIFLACAVSPKNKVANNDPQEEALVRQTIELYFEGWRNQDATKIGKAMHTTCQLKNIKADGGVDGIAVYDRTKYLSFIKPGPPRTAQTRIIFIDVTRDIASAKCEIELPNRIFTDYFNLMKIDGQWYIVDKAATNWAINEKEN